MRIFLDASILFSAAKSEGAVRQLLVLLHKAGHECCVDGCVIDEARRNLVAKTPGGVAMLERLLSRMKTASGQHRRDPALEASLPYIRRTVPSWWPRYTKAVTFSSPAIGPTFGALYGRTLQGGTIHSP